MKLRFLVFCLALAMINLAACAQDNPSQVSAPSGTSFDVGSGDVGLYVNPVGIHITNSQADSGAVRFFGSQYDVAYVLGRVVWRVREFRS